LELNVVQNSLLNYQIFVGFIATWFWPMFLLSTSVLVLTCILASKRIISSPLKQNSHTRNRYIRAFAITITNVLVFILIWLLVINVTLYKNVDAKIQLHTVGSDIEQLINQIESAEGDYFHTIAYFSQGFTQKELARLTKVSNERHANSLVKVQKIVDIRQLVLSSKLIKKLAVYGDGLTDKQWRYFDRYAIEQTLIFDNKQRAGIVEPRWHSHLLLGEKLSISGRFIQDVNSQNNLQDSIVDIVLYDNFDQELTRTRVKLNEPFQLITDVKTIGHFSYRLNVENLKQQVIAEEIVSFVVKENPLAKLLVVQSSPSFEVKQFKNWAGENGAQVVVNTRISKDRFINQQINMTPVNHGESGKQLQQQSLTQHLSFWLEQLNSFDLLLLESRALVEMSHADLTKVINAAKYGLGVFIWAQPVMLDEKMLNEFSREHKRLITQLISGFGLTLAEDSHTLKQKTKYIRWQHNYAKQPLTLAPMAINSSENIVPLLFTTNEQWVAASKDVGNGIITLGLFSNSYHWYTQGESLQYAQLWQMIISHTARKSQKFSWLHDLNQPPLFHNRRYQVCYKLGSASLDELQFNAVVFTQKQDVLEHFCGEFLAEKTGWQVVESVKNNDNQLESSKENWLYVNSEQAWNAHQQYEKIIAGKVYIQLDNLSRQLTGKKERKSYDIKQVKVPFNKYPVGISLVILLTFLWLERKRFLSL